MGWLSRLLGGGKGRGGGIDPAYGDETAQKFRGLLKAGDFASAERLFASFRSDWNRRFFYCFSFGNWPGERPKFLDAWVAAQPDSTAALTVRGYHGIRWAWEARGGGYADSVSEEQWSVFYERLGQAEADLNKAAELDESDPTPLGFLLTIARAKSERSEGQSIFERAVQRDPQCRQAHTQMLQLLTEKWGGSHDEMFRFAREVSDRNPDGSSLHVLTAHAHIEMALAKEDFDYLKEPAVQEPLVQAYRRSIGSASYRFNRLTFMDQNDFAGALALAGEYDLARPLFQSIEGKLTEHPWYYIQGDPVAAYHDLRSVVS
jgi:tetratricopeptide (TPR) repeat protein